MLHLEVVDFLLRKVDVLQVGEGERSTPVAKLTISWCLARTSLVSTKRWVHLASSSQIARAGMDC